MKYIDLNNNVVFGQIWDLLYENDRVFNNEITDKSDIRKDLWIYTVVNQALWPLAL